LGQVGRLVNAGRNEHGGGYFLFAW